MPFGIVGVIVNALVGLVIGFVGAVKIATSVSLLTNGGSFRHCMVDAVLSICIIISAEAVLMPQKTIERTKLTLFAILLGMCVVMLELVLKVNDSWSRGGHTMVMIDSVIGICLVWGQLTISRLLREKLRWNRRPRQVP